MSNRSRFSLTIPFARFLFGFSFFAQSGDLAAWRKQLDVVAEQGQEAARSVAFPLLVCSWAQRDRSAADKAVALIPAEGITNSFDEAPVPREYCVGRTAWLFDDKELAQTALTSARAIFERTTREQPDYPQAWSYLGLTDAMLGRCSEAIQEGKRACELLPIYQGFLDRADIGNLSGIDLCRVRREGSRVGPTGNLSQSSGRNHLRPTKKRSRLGSLARRSAVRENRHVARAERCDFDQVKSDNFFAELKRRNVYKVAVAYAIVGWLLVQIATQVFPFLEIPNWVVRLVIALVAIGFPIALVIAWAFELTPEGLKRTEDVDALLATNAGAAAQPPRKSYAWIYVVIAGAALSVGLFFIGRYTAGNSETPRQSLQCRNQFFD